MTNDWQCPHVEELIEIIDTTNDAIDVELMSERQRIINVLSNRINQLVEELPKQRSRRNIKVAKNSAIGKLARSNQRDKPIKIDNTLMHEVKLFGGVSILLCDDCYRTIQRDIVVDILNDYVGKRETRDVKLTTINGSPVRDNNFRSIE